jgi:replicative DNA helicase
MRAEEVQRQQENEIFYFQHIDESFRSLKREEEHPNKIATLIQSMDEVLRGGVGAGELHLLFAPKKKGKSIFLVNMAAAALQQGKKVAYITMELDTKYVEYRVHSRLTGIPDTELVANETKARAVLNRVKQLKGELDLRKYPTNALTPKKLQAYLDYLWQIKGFNVDLLLVDYLDIMAVDNHYGKRWEKQGPLSEALRGLADIYRIPIWTVTQAKQSAEGKDVVEGTDMGGDSVKAHTADSVWSLMQTPEEAKADPPVGRLFCNYLRNGAGQGQVLEIKYDKKRMLMTDLIR